MDKVVVSLDGSDASRAAVQWCIDCLPRGSTVFAVCGIGELGELVMSVPPFDVAAAEQAIEERLNIQCEPLRRAGLRCWPRLVHRRQVAALLDVVKRECPDALVVGKELHHGIEGLFNWGPLNQVMHRAPCPLMLVPVRTADANRGAAPVEISRFAAPRPDRRSRRRRGTPTPLTMEPPVGNDRPRPY